MHDDMACNLLLRVILQNGQRERDITLQVGSSFNVVRIMREIEPAWRNPRRLFQRCAVRMLQLTRLLGIVIIRQHMLFQPWADQLLPNVHELVGGKLWDHM